MSPEVGSFLEKKTPQIVSNHASEFQESNRRPNVYCFIGQDGQLYTPTGALISNDIRRETYVEQLEGQAYDKIEELSQKAATLMWISPAERGVYKVSKIIITEVTKEDGYTVLLNRAVVLDNVDSEKALKIAQKLALGSVNSPILRTVDDVRASIIVLNPRQRYWLNLLEELAPSPQWEMIRSGQDMELEEQALAAAKLVYEGRFIKDDRERPRSSDYIGSNPLSCTTDQAGAFSVFSGGGTGSEGCNKIRCGKCGWEPNETELKSVQSGEIRSCPRKKMDGKKCGWEP